MDDERLSTLIRNHASRHQAGSRLRAEVRARIALEAAASPTDSDEAGMAAPAQVWWQSILLRLRGGGLNNAMAGFAAGIAMTLLVLPHIPLPAPHPSGALEAELVADHVRSLRDGPLIAVASSDRHTVKPWFQGKLDYAPPVLDLAGDGFPLLGARVEGLRGQPTAVLVFEHHKHVLNVFVWPAGEIAAEARLQRRGFNIVHWSDGSMQYWAVSDMDAGEIEHFGAAWRTARAHL